MLIINLIANESSSHLESILSLYRDSEVFVAYTDNLDTDRYSKLASKFGFSVVHALDKLPMKSMVYDMAWSHLLEAGVTRNDWVLTLHTDEIIVGTNSLPDYSETLQRVGLIPFVQYNSGEDRHILMQPRLFKFEPFGSDFFANHCWPGYVDTLISRKYNSFFVEGLSVLKLTNYVLETSLITKILNGEINDYSPNGGPQ